MRKIDKDGLLLCELQATAFENSVDKMESSSEIFIRRFMKSKIAKRLDNGSVLESNIQANDILQFVDEEYGVSDYGTVKYTRNEMYWIGYIYRYFAIICELTSVQVYKIIKPKELRGLFLPYHTMDPSQAVERILEAKEMPMDENMELERQYKIFKKIRMAKNKERAGWQLNKTLNPLHCSFQNRNIRQHIAGFQ